MNYSDVWSDPDPVRYFGSGLRFRKKRLETKSLPWGTATLSSIYLKFILIWCGTAFGRGPFRLCVGELLLFLRLFISSVLPCICIWIRLFKLSVPGSDVSSRPYLDPTFQIVCRGVRLNNVRSKNNLNNFRSFWKGKIIQFALKVLTLCVQCTTMFSVHDRICDTLWDTLQTQFRRFQHWQAGNLAAQSL